MWSFGQELATFRLRANPKFTSNGDMKGSPARPNSELLRTEPSLDKEIAQIKRRSICIALVLSVIVGAFGYWYDSGQIQQEAEKIAHSIHNTLLLNDRKSLSDQLSQFALAGPSVTVVSKGKEILAATPSNSANWLSLQHLAPIRTSPISEPQWYVSVQRPAWRFALIFSVAVVLFFVFTVGFIQWRTQALLQAAETRKRMESAVATAHRAAQVGHDLRSPLTALSMMQETMDDTESPRSKLISAAVTRINQIAAELLSSHNSQSKNLVPLGADQIDRIFSEIRLRFSQPELVLTHLATRPMFTTQATLNHLQRILSNLTINALEAGATRVTVALTTANNSNQLIVSDNGSGMSQLFIEKALQGSFTTKNHGHGLGLSGAAQWARANGGSVEVASTQGLGTNVSVQWTAI